MYYRLNDDGTVLDYSIDKYHEYCEYTDKNIVTAWDGNWYVEGTEPNMPDFLYREKIQKELSDVAQIYLDVTAQKYGYDHCNSACTYVNTGVAKFDAEGEAFRKWRSAVWNKCYEILDEVIAGERDIPTKEILLAELPRLEVIYA